MKFFSKQIVLFGALMLSLCPFKAQAATVTYETESGNLRLQYSINTTSKVARLTALYTDNNSTTTASNPSIPAAVRYNNVEYPVTEIAANVASYCATRLSGSLIIGSNVKTINASAFKGCTNLTSVYFYDGALETIDSNAFSGCTSLTAIGCVGGGSTTFPNSLKILGQAAFRGCSSLKRMPTFGSKLTTIGSGCFFGTSITGSVVIPASVTTIGQQLFGTNILDSFTFADGTSTITFETVTGSFDPNYNLYPIRVRELYVGRNVAISSPILADIESPWDKNYLTSVTFGPNVTKIAKYFFYKSVNLTDIEIPSTIKTIEDYAFWNGGLKNIVCRASTPPTAGSNSFTGCYSATLNVPQASVATYKAKSPWSNFSTITRIINVHAESLSLSPTSLALKVGESQTLSPTITPANFEDDVEWSVDNPAVATVDATGKVTAVSAGKAVVTVSVYTFTAQCEVTVSVVEASKIVLDYGAITLEPGQTQKLTATVFPENTTDKTVMWSTYNKEVATVAPDGTVTAVAPGETQISAFCGNVFESCTVTVASPQSGVDEIGSNAIDDIFEVYNLQGMKLEVKNRAELPGLAKGVYIVRQGKKTEKIYVR